MSELKIVKFPPFYTQKDINYLNIVKPDVFILDDYFLTSLDNFNLPDSVLYIDFGKNFNKSLRKFKFPKNLKKIKFGDNFSQSLDTIIFPEEIEEIEFGKNFKLSLFCVKFPKTLKEIILGDEFNNSLPFFLPKKIEKIILGKRYDYSLNTWIVPPNLKHLRINGSITNKVLLDKLPENFAILEIVDILDFDMVNLPFSLEELTIDIPKNNYNVFLNLTNNQILPPMQMQNSLGNDVYEMHEQTNLPYNLKKIKLSHVSLVKYLKKIPYNCKIVDLENNPYVL